MTKKKHLIFIPFLLVFSISSNAQTLSRADSIIHYLKQVKGLQHKDTVLLEKAVAAIYVTPPDSLQVDKIESELKKLAPVIQRQNCLAIKTCVGYVLSFGRDTKLAIGYNKNNISELIGYSGDFDRNLLFQNLEQLKRPYINGDRIQEGIGYFQRFAADFEQANDSDAISLCYRALGAFYRTLGLMDKTINCWKKSIVYLNRNKAVKGTDFPIQKYSLLGLKGYINRKAILASALVDNEEPQKAFPVLYEVKNLFESVQDSVDLPDGPFIYLQIIRAKLMTVGDSVPQYFKLMRNILDRKDDSVDFPIYYQTLGYYFYLQNQMDSAIYFIHLSADLIKAHNILFNSSFGFLIPGYYLALIMIKQHKVPEAIKLLNHESNELIKVNIRKVALLELELLSTAYKLNGDLVSSNATLVRYINLHKEIIDDENKNRSMSFETEQQINLLNSERQKQHREISRQKLFRNLVGGGLALMLLFSMLFLFQRIRISKEKKRSEELLLNILPAEVATELKQTGRCQAKTFSMVTVMFMDFKDFTNVSEKVSAELLVDEINFCFSAFDGIIQKHKVEKIKTVGDAYICVGGLPVLNYSHALDVVNAAIEIRDFMLSHKKEKEARGEIPFELRIGIHTGPVVAGIVGVKKFQYDIWGDTVNLAARMEQNSEAGKINISGSTYQLVKDKFTCSYRGKVEAKNKGEVDMYFVEGNIFFTT
jgi:class 3 adenylate cyclase